MAIKLLPTRTRLGGILTGLTCVPVALAALISYANGGRFELWLLLLAALIVLRFYFHRLERSSVSRGVKEAAPESHGTHTEG